MFDSVRKYARTVATMAVAAALAVGGVAVAQSGSGSGQSGPSGGKARGPHPGGPPPIGPPMKAVTYAEFHVQRNGEDQTIRLDQGKITAVDSSSITLTENDGNSVTVALDEDTKVLAGPGRDSTVDDLSVGQRVVVCGPEGGAAKVVAAVPKHRPGKGGPGGRRGGPDGMPQMPPPPGAPQGSQGGSGS